MIDDIDKRLQAFGYTVLRHKFINILRHEAVVKKHIIPLEDVIDSFAYQKYLSYNDNYRLEPEFRCAVIFLGQTVEFTNKALVTALTQLPTEQLQIVFLHYCLQMADEDICDLLRLSSRSAVLRRRKKALKKLRILMYAELGDN